MGVSFKINKVGTRFCPKPLPAEKTAVAGDDDDGDNNNSSEIPGRDGSSLSSSSKRKHEEYITQVGEDALASPVSSNYCREDRSTLDQELSFTLDLFPDGFSIGKPTENGTLEPLFREVPKSLYPYNRSSETLFSAIEMGKLPGDILDDIPSKYINGSVFCEVRDYRMCINEPGTVGSVVDGLPIVHKVRLRMSLENVVKDIPSMSDDSWTYGDLMEVESRIVKAIQPQLHLDPTPMLDRLCETPISSKLDLGICQARKKRLKQMAEVIVTSNSQTHGKKVSIERILGSTNCKYGEIGPTPGDGTIQHVHDNLAVQPSVVTKSFGQDVSRSSLPFSGQAKIQSTISYPRHYQDRGSGMPPTTLSTNTNNGLAASQEMINSYNESSRNLHGRRENQDTQMSHMSGMKRTNQAPSLDGLVQHPQVASTLDSIHGTDVSWKTSMSQHQIDTRGIQYSNIEGPKYPIGDARQAIPEASSNQEGVSPFYLDQRMLRHGIKEERMETESTAKQEIDSLIAGTGASQINQLQRQSQQAFVRSHFPSQTQWHNLGTLVEKDPRRDEPLQKRRPAQSPRFSGGAVVQPPASSKSGDNSSGSMGPHCGPVSSAQGSQKDKATAISGDSVHWHHQSSGKRKPSSVSKNPAIGGVASPASVSNVNIPMNASSPSVGTPPMADQILLDRFSKIDAVTTRYQLNGKKKKVEDYPMMKRPNYFSQEVSNYLSNSVNNEDVIDSNSSNPMSSSLIGGSLNTCKSRIINFMQPERIYQGNGVSIVLPRSRDRLTLIERSRDGMVALVRGEIDENEYMPFLEHIPAFPNTNYADLLCAQFSALMVREGYQIMDDQIRAAPTRIGNASFGPSNTAAVSSDIAPSENQYRENVSGQLPSTVSPSNSGLTPMTQSQNVLSSPRLLSPGNVQSVQMSQGYLPGGGIPARPPQLEQTQLPPQPSQQSQIQQNQHAPMQKSLLLQSSLSNIGAIGQNANLNMSNPMMNKAAASLQLRLLQQQQQQQQQPQMARKMMMGLGGAMGMGNLGNSVVGMGGVRGMGPGISAPMGLTSGISAPMGMGPIAGVGSMGQNPINLSQASNITNMLNQHIRSGSLSPAQATAMASKLMQSRGLGTQTGIAGMSGSGQMHGGSPFSMLGQNLNRGNMNPMQRTAMATMGPPKIPGMNAYMNQQQQMQLQPQQLQQLQQHQQFQQLQQQQQHHHQQQQQQQQLQQQQQQLQQQQQQQQQMSSPLQNQQAILSPPQVGSPAMAIQQQLSQQQQIGSPQVSQQNPMSPQLSAGALQQMNNVGNSGLTPASPQLSSQTLGSVGSISSSPMELQGVNKGNSINNV